MRKYFYFFLAAAAALSTTSCKHHTSTPDIDLVKDSVYLYTQEDYLWYDALPSMEAFNPRSFTGSNDLNALQSEVDALSQYKINPATGNPYEYNTEYHGESKYSFIDQGQVSTLLAGSSADFGFYPFYSPISNTDLHVRYVNPGSPAAKAGLHRGELIINVVGVPGLDVTNSTDLNALYAALSASSITMTLKRANGTTYTATITAASYTTNPVMKDTVYTTSNNKKVGYLVFSTFTDLDNAKAPLDAAFDYFIGQNITDLIVDLRYNGGGVVQTAEYLDNLIVPSAKSGTTMYTAYYNNKLQADNYPLLASQYAISKGDFLPANNTAKFLKQKSLNISRVIFIVTAGTASASELAINNLRPEMDVKLVGKTTYGKPVGFFAIPINAYQLYVPEFETKNSAGQGGYYTGMDPGTADYPGYYSEDDVTHDFGDPAENLLARSLSYINVGTYAIPEKQVQSTNSAPLPSVQQVSQANSKLKGHAFNGMVFKNTKIKLKRRHF